MCITDRKVTEEFNLRSAITSYSAAHGSPNTRSISARQRDFLPAADVKWSHGQYDSVIATAASNGRIALYDLKRPEVELAWLHEHTRSVHKLAFDPHQGYLLLSGSHDGTVKMWDLRNLAGERAALAMKSVRQYQGRADAVRDLRWSPTDAFEFVMCTDAGVIQTWDIRKWDAPKLRLAGHEKACNTVDWHPDGRHVVSGGFDKYIRVWDMKKEDRRQKPCFQLRAPQTVMNIRWRPLCWSAELAGTGDWQSTQIATNYSQDDPRVHVWDLRRPHIPFRELDRYNSPATDLLWCDKNLLWTVGNEGMFTQTDVQFAPQVHDQISPCTIKWLPSGEYAVFAEDRGARRGSGLEDPSLGFLNVPYHKLSSGKLDAVSKSPADDDVVAEGFSAGSIRRRQSKTASTRSTKSQANSPPSQDDPRPVLPLDKAVSERRGLFKNRQIGLIGETTGTAMEPLLVRFLAENYARASTASERKDHPNMILERLETVFKTNAEACDHVSRYRAGQSWRILGAVIVPELRMWADRNRIERLSKKAEKERADHIAEQEKTKKEADKRVHKMIGHMFRGVMDKHGNSGKDEVDSTSNMTTPIARPFPDSSPSGHVQLSSQPYRPLSETIDTIPQLPPSVMNAHSTAAAAAKALQDDAAHQLHSPRSPNASGLQADSSPSKHHRSNTEESSVSFDGQTSLQTTPPQPVRPLEKEWPSTQSSFTRSRPEEERRAALRDYKAQTRPLLTFNEPSQAGPRTSLAGRGHRHDSTDSFPMFSTSTGSSHKARSSGVSSDSPGKDGRRSATPDSWLDRQHAFEPSSPSFRESAGAVHPDMDPIFCMDKKSAHHYVEHANDHNLGLDGAVESQPGPTRNRAENGSQDSLTDYEVSLSDESYSRRESSLASPPKEPFHFELARPSTVVRADSAGSRPLRPQPRQIRREPVTLAKPLVELDLGSSDYILTDFYPIDPDRPGENGAPRLAWSSLPLVAETIAFDLASGEACGQFSTHLLMHVHPFFFHPHFRSSQSTQPLQHRSIAKRLMHPHYSHKIIESIFQSHHQFLKQNSLHIPAAELRDVCVEGEYPSIYKPPTAGEDSNDSLTGGDNNLIFQACAYCFAPMPGGCNVCTRCKRPRDPCPICLTLNLQPDETSRGKLLTNGRSLWTSCAGCGHAAHAGCMEDWLGHPYSQGECPSLGCGHDCGPGVVREERLARQANEEAERKLVRPSGSSGGAARKDRWKAPGSAAVERTRRVLRENETESGGSGRVGGRSMSSGAAGMGERRKVVRLITPGEEREAR